MLAQHLFHHRLRYLLTCLGEPVIAPGRQPEGALEVSDPPPGQRVAERDTLRPGDRQRRGGPQRVRRTPPAQNLQRPHARGLRPRPAARDHGPRLDHDALDPVQAELRGRGQARWATTCHQHSRAPGARRGHITHEMNSRAPDGRLYIGGFID
jgi:hypothetical protein